MGHAAVLIQKSNKISQACSTSLHMKNFFFDEIFIPPPKHRIKQIHSSPVSHAPKHFRLLNCAIPVINESAREIENGSN